MEALQPTRKRKLDFGHRASLIVQNPPQFQSLLEVTPLYQPPLFSDSPVNGDSMASCESTRLPLPLVLGRQTLSILWWKHCPNRCGVHRTSKAMRQGPFYWTDCCDSCHQIRGVRQTGKSALSLQMVEINERGHCRVVARHRRTIRLVDHSGQRATAVPHLGLGAYLLICDRRQANGPCHWMYFKLRWIDDAADEALQPQRNEVEAQRAQVLDTSLRRVQQQQATKSSVLLDREEYLGPSNETFSGMASQAIRIRPFTQSDSSMLKKIVTPGCEATSRQEKATTLQDGVGLTIAESCGVPDSNQAQTNSVRSAIQFHPRHTEVDQTPRVPEQIDGLTANRRETHFQSATESSSQASSVLHLPCRAGGETQQSLTMQEATQPHLHQQHTSKERTAIKLCRTMTLDDWKKERDVSVPGSYRRCIIDAIVYINERSKVIELDQGPFQLWLPTVLEDYCTLD